MIGNLCVLRKGPAIAHGPGSDGGDYDYFGEGEVEAVDGLLPVEERRCEGDYRQLQVGPVDGEREEEEAAQHFHGKAGYEVIEAKRKEHSREDCRLGRVSRAYSRACMRSRE